MKQYLSGQLLTKHELQRCIGKEVIPCSDYQRIEGIRECGSYYQCARCHNTDRQKFAYLSDAAVYCVNCIQMGRIASGDFLYYFPAVDYEPSRIIYSQLTWRGNLSDEQARASRELLLSLSDITRPHLIHAVTGAGKTEMIFASIQKVLGHGGRVCLASPRIDVCRELYPRIVAAFNKASVEIKYGGSENVRKYSDILIATTHQLLRYKSAFNLVIVDEVDAFPYVDDEMLHFAVKRAVKEKIGKLVYLTATPDAYLKKQCTDNLLTQTILPARYHGYGLPEPEFRWVGDWRKQILKRQLKGKLYKLLLQFCQITGRRLIFMPHIELAEQLFASLSKMLPGMKIACVHSKDSDRQTKVDQFRTETIDILISTTILERGVTFKNCHVCVVGAEHYQYSSASLVQISGRVGRKPDFPTGTLIYAHFGYSKAMKEAAKEIHQMNQLARKKGLIQ